jgi:hypothetical protein
VSASETITIAGRYCGPPTTGNGGYSAGMLAAKVEPDDAVEVTLRHPPPLDRPLRIERGETVRAFDGDDLVMEAVAKALALDMPEPPSWDEAEQMSRHYLGFEGHLFPNCFTCGPERAEGDGLRLFAGRSEPSGPVAAPWQPNASLADDGIVRPAVVWAALDCPGYFAVTRSAEMALLGRMHAQVDGPLQAGARYVIAAWSIGREGRKRHALTAVYSADDGRCVGRARQTWIALRNG